MAQYKVPQDVEADDKLIGPFGFRQFIYLLIVAALGGVAYIMGRIFFLLAFIPLIPALFLLILALPLRKEQPMETYIAALISFYTKPTKRFFNPGQRESTILITAPKIIEKIRTKNISSDDAGRRLSFLASVVDSEGYSIKEGASTPVRDEFVAEANSTPDMFDVYETTRIDSFVEDSTSRQHASAIAQMRAAIEKSNSLTASAEPLTEAGNPAFAAAPPAYNPSSSFTNPFGTAPSPSAPAVEAEEPIDFSVFAETTTPADATEQYKTPGSEYIAPKTVPVAKNSEDIAETTENSESKEPEEKVEESVIVEPDEKIFNLAHDGDFSVATIAKEAKRISRKADNEEVYISLH